MEGSEDGKINNNLVQALAIIIQHTMRQIESDSNYLHHIHLSKLFDADQQGNRLITKYYRNRKLK